MQSKHNQKYEIRFTTTDLNPRARCNWAQVYLYKRRYGSSVLLLYAAGALYSSHSVVVAESLLSYGFGLEPHRVWLFCTPGFYFIIFFADFKICLQAAVAIIIAVKEKMAFSVFSILGSEVKFRALSVTWSCFLLLTDKAVLRQQQQAGCLCDVQG